MNEYQTHALKVLDTLMKSERALEQGRTARSIRITSIIGCPEEVGEGYKYLPKSFCYGWAFCMRGIPDTFDPAHGAHFSAALDVELQSRKRKNESYYVWTQGSSFAMAEGYTLTRSDHSEIVQVALARDVEPAKCGIRRDPGQISCKVYAPDDTPGKIWKFSHMLDLTQDDFVRFLITGEHG
jgi:hypothetical protein